MNTVMRQFFVLTGGPDGIHFEGPITEGELLNRITPNEHGETYYGNIKVFLSNIPDLDYMQPDELFIIEGEVVIPKAKQVVQEYKV